MNEQLLKDAIFYAQFLRERLKEEEKNEMLTFEKYKGNARLHVVQYHLNKVVKLIAELQSVKL